VHEVVAVDVVPDDLVLGVYAFCVSASRARKWIAKCGVMPVVEEEPAGNIAAIDIKPDNLASIIYALSVSIPKPEGSLIVV
jgi:hypothetical protein